MIKTILFDLDGTLLPMDQDVFVKAYFKGMAKKVGPLGYEPKSLVENIWKGTYGMIQNDGSCTNEEVFWNVFSQSYGNKVYEDKPVFDEFYHIEFQDVQSSCGYNEKVKEVIKQLKNNYQLLLATNPIFPCIATYSRVRWAGLETTDFEYITTYENSHSCKPNLYYYQELVDKFNLNPEECLMVGNDVSEDMVASKLGMKVFLITDCLINKDNVDINQYPHGNFDDLLEYVKKC